MKVYNEDGQYHLVVSLRRGKRRHKSRCIIETWLDFQTENF